MLWFFPSMEITLPIPAHAIASKFAVTPFLLQFSFKVNQ